METMVISCPECGTKMKVPESTFGKKVRCKKCEQVFAVRPPRKAAIAVRCWMNGMLAVRPSGRLA